MLTLTLVQHYQDTFVVMYFKSIIYYYLFIFQRTDWAEPRTLDGGWWRKHWPEETSQGQRRKSWSIQTCPIFQRTDWAEPRTLDVGWWRKHWPEETGQGQRRKSWSIQTCPIDVVWTERVTVDSQLLWTSFSSFFFFSFLYIFICYELAPLI